MEAILDLAQLSESLDAMGGDPQDALALMLDLYLEDAPRLLAELLQAASSEDFPALAFSAHSLKSSSATLGCRRLARLCQQIELQARNQEKANLAPLAYQIQATYQATLTALRQPGIV